MQITSRTTITAVGVFLVILSGAVWWRVRSQALQRSSSDIDQQMVVTSEIQMQRHPLMIEVMREREYPASELIREQTLATGSNYSRYIASYLSDDLKQYGLLTIPDGTPPAGGWPAIIFNHGYIPPEEYRTTERYIAYVDALARSGFVVFKPDYRGHGDSEGEPEGAYYSPAYTTDVLNAFSSVQQLPEVNPSRVGMWGHSMGGHITLRSMVIRDDIKAGVVWGGVVATYPTMMEHWSRGRSRWTPSPREQAARRSNNRETLMQSYGDFATNPDFWAALSPNAYVNDLSGPLQIHHGEADETVPVLFSRELRDQLVEAQMRHEYFEYTGGDHNLSDPDFSVAMERTIAFFTQYL